MTPSIFAMPASYMVVACAAVTLSACTNMSGLDGKAEYGCKAPQGVQCESVSGNYYNALQNNLPSQRQGRSPEVDAEKTHVTRSPNVPADTRSAGSLNTMQAGTDGLSATSVAAPLRSQSRMLRLWFKPWEDADHDLYDQGYVYVQIDNGRWLVDHAQRRIRDVYAPIRAPRSAPQVAQGTGTSSKAADPAGRITGSPTAPVRPLIRTPDAPGVDIR
jgi:conjugal transfer pilus assembly protein TraV